MGSFQSRFMNVVLRLLGAKKMFAKFHSAKESPAEFQTVVAKYRKQDWTPEPPQKVAEKYNHERHSIEDSGLHILEHDNSENVIFFLHGGAYVLGLSGLYWTLIDKIATQSESSIAVFDYPLAPEHNVETAVSRTAQAYELLQEKYGAENIIVAGDSAGGGLAMALAHTLRDQQRPLPRKIVLIYPWLDVTMSQPEAHANQGKDLVLGIDGLITCGHYYAGDLDPKNPLVSPLFGDLGQLPPIMVLTGSSDILHQQSRLLADKVDAAGGACELHVYPDMQHAWLMFGMPEATDGIQKVATAVRQS